MKVSFNPSSMGGRRLFSVILFLYWAINCDGQCWKYSELTVEMKLLESTASFHGIVLSANRSSHIYEMALVSIYQGGTTLASISPYSGSIYNTTDRQVTLKIPVELDECWPLEPQKEYVIFAKVADPVADAETTPLNATLLESTAQPMPWKEEIDRGMWNIMNWSFWSEWGPCNKTCGGGTQVRNRTCRDMRKCEGFTEQTRACNTFDCEGTINPLAPEFRKLFNPAEAQWKTIENRTHAFSLYPNSSIWISSSELFVPEKTFPKEYTIFVSLRLRKESNGYGQGTLFSLRSRRKSDSYLSLELAGRETAELVHSGDGTTTSIPIAVRLCDLLWHHIAISVHDDNTVEVFVDCEWLRADVLDKSALVTPEDADLNIGYLFSGDLEQLTIVPRAGEADHQCSSQITDIELVKLLD